MKKAFLSYFIGGLVLFTAFSLTGCGSESGAIVDAPQLVAQTYDENCSLCHSSGSVADVAVAHSLESNSPQFSISAVREVNVGVGDDRLELDFKIVDTEFDFLPPVTISSASSIRFALAKLDTSTGGSGSWQSYINSSETKDANTPGTGADGTFTQATYERGNAGTLTDNGNGNYTYQFSLNMNTVTDPVSSAAITYDKAMTHRIAIQYSDNVDNAYVDFVPNDLPTLDTGATRDIVVNSTCNDCHIKLGLHGGDRINVNFCVTCHNPGSTDANSGNSVDFGLLIHKIHAGEELSDPYIIWGHNDSEHDYSEVVFPPGIQDCIKCHTGAADSDNWKNSPSSTYCGSCHDAPSNSGSFTSTQIETAHEDSAQVAAQTIEFNILSATTAAGSTGDYDLTIQFSITDPSNGDAAYDITDTSTVDFTGLSFLIGWNTSDYTNEDGGSTPAQPPRISIEDATDTGSNVYSLTASAVVPADITGSGVVALQGHPLMDLDGDGAVDDNVPATSVAKSFAITDATAQDRRSIVDIDNCNNCHGFLSLHGGNRNNSIETCVICHNADATDISVRPADGTATADGKAEESIDFKYMIHSIHAGESSLHGFRENGIVVYGFRGSVNDFGHVALPAGTDNLMNCEGCHSSGTYEVPIDTNALPTTVSTGVDVSDPDDDSNITPTASVCSSCHDSIGPKTHMASEGGVFDFKPVAQAVSDNSDEVELCGPGPVSSQPAGHSARTDCCSCHSPR